MKAMTSILVCLLMAGVCSAEVIINGFSFDPTQLNIPLQNRIEVFVELTTSCPVDWAGVMFTHAITGQAKYLVLELVSGNLCHGTYYANEAMNYFSCSGLWQANLDVNTTCFEYEWFYPEELAELGWPTDLIVENHHADCDDPVLISFEADPNVVDISTGNRQVQITAHLRDDNGIACVYFTYWAPEGFQHINAVLHSVYNNGYDHLWEGTIELPANATLGIWTPEVQVADLAGNSLDFDREHMIQHFPESLFQVTDSSPVEPCSWGQIKAIYR